MGLIYSEILSEMGWNFVLLKNVYNSIIALIKLNNVNSLFT